MKAHPSDKRSYLDWPRVGVGLVILLNGKLLLVKRRKEPGRNMWTLPGGLIEIGETAEQAAKREVREELGIDIEIDSLIEVVDFIEEDPAGKIKYHYVLLDYLAYAVSGKLRPSSDVSDFRLVGRGEIDSLEVPDLTKRFLRQNRKKIFLH